MFRHASPRLAQTRESCSVALYGRRSAGDKPRRYTKTENGPVSNLSPSKSRPDGLFSGADSARSAAFSFALVLAWPFMAPVHGQEVAVTRIDGVTMHGTWNGLADGDCVRILAADGAAVLSMDELSRVDFSNVARTTIGLRRTPHRAATDGAPRPDAGAMEATQAIVHLPHRAAFIGVPIDAGPSADDIIALRTAWAETLTIPFDQLAALQFAGDEEYPKAATMFRAALADRKPGEDVLISRDLDEVNAARGRVERVDDAGGRFVFGDRSRNFRFEKLFGIVFAAGATEPGRPPVRALLTDGSTVPGRLVASGGDRLRLATPWGADLDLPLGTVAQLTFLSDRVVYLSDLKPVEQSVEGLLHRPWSIVVDHNVTGGPLSIAGRSFDKGIGVHSKTSLTYSLNGTYESFAATIGLDDAVRPRGSVVFRVIGDGTTLCDTGSVTGAEAAKDILVAVSGVKSLTLLVEYGDQLDIADQADWADARLIKQKPAKETPKPKRAGP